MQLLENKVAVVTGSGQGIGRAIALRLASEGARVVVNNRCPDSPGGSAAKVADEIRAFHGEAIPVFADVSSVEGGERVIREAMDHFGKLDILVNNAGVIRRNLLWNMTEEEWDEVIRVNLRGAFVCSRAAARIMREQQSGCIINISSRAGIHGRPGVASYVAAKAGIIGFTLAMAIELQPYRVRVNCVCPSASTRMSSSPGTAVPPGYETPKYLQRRFVKERPPEAVAPLIAYLASYSATDISGKVFYIGGGEISVHYYLEPVRTLYKEGMWDVKELSDFLPSLL